MRNLIALAAVMVWPIIPLFWIPVHGLPRVFRRIGLLTYIVIPTIWLFLAYFLYINRGILLQHKVHIPAFLAATGAVLLIAGTLIHIWTAKLLGISGLVGLPEISAGTKERFVETGPFSFVRHPTYLAHTIMFLGIFLMTGVITVGIITVADFLVINLIVIPMEERELFARFGKPFLNYKGRVPAYFPLSMASKRMGRRR